MNSTDRILSNLESRPFSIREWFKKHMIGILSTLIFHTFLLILFLLFKIQSVREQKDALVIMDFAHEQPEIIPPDKNALTPSEIDALERMLSQRTNASNRASNISENMEKEISTKSYIEEVEEELNLNRTEEWRKLQEEIERQKTQEDYVPEPAKNKKEDKPAFHGITNITYEFLEAPLNRNKISMPVPVYKCKGEGTVMVDISVDQFGKVISTRAFTNGDFPDKDCMMEVAEKYAAMSRFSGNLSAPKSHRARIVYKFIAQ